MITKRRFFFAWDEQKELKFLNEMATEGKIFKKVRFFKYYFEEGLPQTTKFAADFRSFDKMKEAEYLQLYQDAGWAYVCKYGGWYYFQCLGDSESSLLFNDYQSQLDKYKRILLYLLIIGVPLYYQILIFFPNMEASELKGFYYGFRFVVYPLVCLHAFAVLKLWVVYFKISKKIQNWDVI